MIRRLSGIALRTLFACIITLVFSVTVLLFTTPVGTQPKVEYSVAIAIIAWFWVITDESSELTIGIYKALSMATITGTGMAAWYLFTLF